MYLPLFVTANLPITAINSVLQNAITETFYSGSNGELVGNRWVIIEHPAHQPSTLPTNPPVPTFRSGFLDYTAQELQRYVSSKCGQHGIGQDDWLEEDAFGVIDSRTAEDNTIAYYHKEDTDRLMEAAVNVAWGRASEMEVALVMYMDPLKRPDEKAETLSQKLDKAREQSIGDDDPLFLQARAELWQWSDREEEKWALKWCKLQGEETSKIRDAMDKLDEWIEHQREQSETKWFEFRLAAETALQNTYGIWEMGAADTLVDRREYDFDDNGVLMSQEMLQRSRDEL